MRSDTRTLYVVQVHSSIIASETIKYSSSTKDGVSIIVAHLNPAMLDRLLGCRDERTKTILPLASKPEGESAPRTYRSHPIFLPTVDDGRYSYHVAPIFDSRSPSIAIFLVSSHNSPISSKTIDSLSILMDSVSSLMFTPPDPKYRAMLGGLLDEHDATILPRITKLKMEAIGRDTAIASGLLYKYALASVVLSRGQPNNFINAKPSMPYVLLMPRPHEFPAEHPFSASSRHISITAEIFYCVDNLTWEDLRTVVREKADATTQLNLYYNCGSLTVPPKIPSDETQPSTSPYLEPYHVDQLFHAREAAIRAGEYGETIPADDKSSKV